MYCRHATVRDMSCELVLLCFELAFAARLSRWFVPIENRCTFVTWCIYDRVSVGCATDVEAAAAVAAATELRWRRQRAKTV